MNSKLIRYTTVVLCMACVFPRSIVLGDMILIQGQETPIYGVVVSADENTVTFRPWNADGTTRPQITTNRTDIELLAVTIDSERLKKSAGNFKDLFAYAEELAAMSNDPASLAAAEQLYRRIAKSTSGNLRTSALRAMLALEKSNVRKRSIAAFALIKDPGFQFAKDVDFADALVAPDPTAIGTLIRAIQEIRSGNRMDAGQVIKTQDIQALDVVIRPVCTIDALYQYSLKPDLADEQLAVLLRCEQRLREVQLAANGNPISETSANQWTPEKMKNNSVFWPDLSDR